MTVRRPIRKRFLKIKGQRNETAGERASRQACRYIQNNPYFAHILRAIRQGTPNSVIAEDCIAKGYFDVNSKTAIGYLQYFKRANPDLCRPELADLTDRETVHALDDLFDGNEVVVDEEVELVRAIKLQKARLAIAFRNEKNLGVLMNIHAKEIQVLGELIDTLAKIRGKTGGTAVNNLPYGDNVKVGLKDIQQEESQRNVLASMISEMVAVSNG